jgi:hypothetical protein
MPGASTVLVPEPALWFARPSGHTIGGMSNDDVACDGGDGRWLDNTAGWTPRQYITLLLAVGRNAELVQDAEEIMGDLRATIARLERQTEATRG